MKVLAGILLSSLALASYSLNAADVGVGVKAGTLGYGADFTVTLTRTVNARVSLTSYSVDSESETVTVGDATNEGTINATADVDFGSSGLLFDWHVFDGTFHLTAGLVKADIGVNFKGALADDFIINGKEVKTSDINGLITGDISLSDSYRPYLGIGWGRKAAVNPGFSFSAEIGVAFLDPKVNLNATASGAGISQAELDARLNEAESSADNDLADLDLWPVLSVGINYAF